MPSATTTREDPFIYSSFKGGADQCGDTYQCRCQELNSGYEINDSACQHRHKPIEQAWQIPRSPVEPTPPRHVGALPCAELSDPAILCLGVLAGDKPDAAYRTASAPHAEHETETALQTYGDGSVYKRRKINHGLPPPAPQYALTTAHNCGAGAQLQARKPLRI